MSNISTTLLAAALAACCGGAAAQAPAPDSLYDTIRFGTYENDMYFNTDRYYTNGIQLSQKRSKDTRGDFARAWTRRLCEWADCAGHALLSTQANVGQLMYTPNDITVREPQPLDRPWAGLLYYEQVYTLVSPDQRTLTTLTGQVGVTGRFSLAEQSQKLAHRVLDRPYPQGWDNQIGGTLGVMASAERRTARESLSADLWRDVRLNTATYYRLAVGNVMTYAAGGVAVVVGKDLPLVSPPPPGIGNKLNMAAPGLTTCMVPWLQCTAFGALEARAMVYNVFIDGRLLRDDPKVKRRNVVADLMVGMRLDFPHTRTASHGPWFLQFKATRRTQEIRSSIPVQRHLFGALTIGTEF